MPKLMIPEYPLCRIIDSGEIYDTYTTFLPDYFPELDVIYKYETLENPDLDKKYFFIASHAHSFNPEKEVCVILDLDLDCVFLIGREGIAIQGEDDDF